MRQQAQGGRRNPSAIALHNPQMAFRPSTYVANRNELIFENPRRCRDGRNIVQRMVQSVSAAPLL
jgi:hypothetical protein